MSDDLYSGISHIIFISDIITYADVIIIPGSSRIELAEQAYYLFNKGLAKSIVISGSKNKKLKGTTEADFLKQALIRKGVQQNRIILERKARNTYENALFSLWKCQEHGINTNKIIIVCKNYHAQRVKLTFGSIFKDSKIMISPVCDSSNITVGDWYKDKYKKMIVMNEIKKIGIYMQKNEQNSYIKSMILRLYYVYMSLQEKLFYSGR